MKLVTIALAAGAAAIGTFAVAAASLPSLGPPPAPGTGLPSGQCILSHDIRNHSVVDKNTLLLDVGGPRKGLYRFTMHNACLTSAVSADPIDIRQVGRGTVCEAKDLSMSARSGICAIDSIVRLTPEEVAALPRKLRP
jgi:hypothetical protein